MEDAQNKGTLNAKFQPELSQNQRLESEKNADSKICPCDIHVNPSGLRKSKYSPPPLSSWMQKNSKKPQSTPGNPSERFLTRRTRFLSLISTPHHIRCSLSQLQLELWIHLVHIYCSEDGYN